MINWKKAIINSAVGVLAGTLCVSTFAGDLEDFYEGCNIAGLERIDATDPSDDTYLNPLGDRANHVFLARLGNNGGGNGGESYDIHFWGPLGVFGLDCISTADEDTNGGLYSGNPDDNPTRFDQSMFAPEIDPN